MTRRLLPALTILLFLISCATTPNNTPPPASSEAGEPVAESTRAPSASPGSTPVPRNASFSEIENLVEARASESESFAPATVGQTLPVGGEVRTGDGGRARLDLLPDGTIVRVAPNSTFALAALEETESGPSSKIQLAFGKIWILLKGGSLDVDTPSGVASVRGSLLGVSFNPETKSLTATCLEGHCALSDDDESIELTDGQAVDSVDGDIDEEPREMTEEEQQEWVEEAPESEEFLEESAEATEVPTDAATEVATEAPTEEPTEEATEVPTDAPTEEPPTEPPVDEPPTEPPAEEPPPEGFIFVQR